MAQIVHQSIIDSECRPPVCFIVYTHSLNSTTPATSTSSITASPPQQLQPPRLLSSSSSSAAPASSSASEDVVSFITGGFFASFLSRLVTVSSLLTINSSKLSADDFSGETPPWTTGFFGACDSYLFPSSSQQARMRVRENIKRLARNYPTLFIVFFACAFATVYSVLKVWLNGILYGKERYYTSRCRSSEATSLAATFKELLTRHKSTVGEFPTKNEDWVSSLTVPTGRKYAALASALGTLPWEKLQSSELKQLARESEYTARTLANGYALNHVTISVHRLKSHPNKKKKKRRKRQEEGEDRRETTA
ncbi:hypothetical protein Bca52824_026782 [Brassica carinata]|uniref:Uncharacterized protein n=1 Tax=Brassica carinata TaxID=52824 RepID=A0A8X7V949_BRACI|nr:hypothetical protein Bca52824_026782 [Brassica carinata]